MNSFLMKNERQEILVKTLFMFRTGILILSTRMFLEQIIHSLILCALKR